MQIKPKQIASFFLRWRRFDSGSEVLTQPNQKSNHWSNITLRCFDWESSRRLLLHLFYMLEFRVEERASVSCHGKSETFVPVPLLSLHEWRGKKGILLARTDHRCLCWYRLLCETKKGINNQIFHRRCFQRIFGNIIYKLYRTQRWYAIVSFLGLGLLHPTMSK